nr:hypothetical protein [Tanacetum cinerariifolium]
MSINAWMSILMNVLVIKLMNKKGRFKSFVWDHFPRPKEGATETTCPYCSTVLAANSKQNGTSTLGNHLKNICVTSPLYRSKDKKKQTKLSFKPATMGESGGTLVSHSFNQERCRKAVARMCIKDNQPFSIVEDEGFSELVWELNLEFELPSRWTVARDALSIYQEEAQKLKNILKDQTMCLTTDTWTSVQNYNYICLTAHWVDNSSKLRKKILNFCRISNHKCVTIGNLVYRCLQEWGNTRVFTVTVDNASSNDGAIRRNKILLFAKFEMQVKYLRSSSGRQESFENGVKFEKVNCKRKPCFDVDTRWNSTFLMLETAVKFQKVFDRYFNILLYYFYNEPEDGEEGTRMIPKCKKKKKNVVRVPNEDDWSNASEPVNTSHNASLQKIYAFDLIQLLMFNSRAETSNQCDQVSKRLKTLFGKTIEICKIVEDALKELYAHYMIKFDKQNDETFTVSSSSTHSEDDCSMKIDLDDGFTRYLETQYGEGDDYTKVDMYLKDGAEKRRDNSFDVLGWWNQNMMKFPILSQVAKHVLAMPISTVVSESAFSTDGRVIDKHRSSLTPKTAEALICAQDWLRSTPANLFGMARGRVHVMAVKFRSKCWTWVFDKNKHHQTKPIDNPYVKDVDKIATSFFVTNFPNSLDAKNLWKEFLPFGRIDDAFIANKRSKQVVLIKVKEIKTISNMYYVCQAEGFVDVKIHYVGGLWVWLQFSSVNSCGAFKSNESLNKFGPSLSFLNLPLLLMNELFRLRFFHRPLLLMNEYWIEVSGLPLCAWGSSAFKKIANLFDKFNFFNDDVEDSMCMGRACITTKIQSFISEKVNVTIKDSNFNVHVKEIGTWSTLISNDMDSNESDDDHDMEEHRLTNEDVDPNAALDDFIQQNIAKESALKDSKEGNQANVSTHVAGDNETLFSVKVKE